MRKKFVIPIMIFCTLSLPSFARNAIFDSYNTTDDVQKIDITPVARTSTIPVQTNYQETNIKVATQKTTPNVGQIQNDNYKQAIQSLDASQAEIREELVQYTHDYNEAKVRYDNVKAECKELRKQIRTRERKIRNIERTKKDISKNIIESL